MQILADTNVPEEYVSALRGMVTGSDTVEVCRIWDRKQLITTSPRMPSLRDMQSFRQMSLILGVGMPTFQFSSRHRI